MWHSAAVTGGQWQTAETSHVTYRYATTIKRKPWKDRELK